MNKLRERFRNRRQRPAAWPKNMVVLYLLCIILPLLVTDAIFIALLVSSGRNDLKYSYEKAAENIAFRFANILDSASNITMNIIKNEEFEKFLEKDYDSGLSYYEAYWEVTNDKFLDALCSINNSTFEIYTDNPTVVNGGGIYSIDRAKQQSWYSAYVTSGRESMVMFYYDTETGAASQPRRRLLYISNMDYFPHSRYKKICRIVMDYSAFARNIESVAAGENGYIADDENVYVFTEGYNNISDDFRKLSDVKGRIGYSRDFVYSDSPFVVNVFENTGYGMASIRRNWPLLLLMLLLNSLFPIFFAKLTQTVQAGKIAQQETDIARQQAELLALHSQINPHFLFNALESIRMHSVLRGEDETAQMVEKLAVIERKNADWNEDDTTIENEMDFVDAYLKLQQYRFGDRLNYEIDVEEGLQNVMIPRLTITTFVENACVHGIEGKSSPGWIFVRVYMKDGDMIIEIEDTGEGISDKDVADLTYRMENASIDELKGKGRIGIVNAALRLKIATENNVKFMIESEAGIGTTISVTVPGEYVHEKSIAR